MFSDSTPFVTPKPHELIERILQLTSDTDSVILDSFAGSGTTAHAVLNMNKADGGNRKFILVEMMDYAESITAERVKRVIDGYGEGKNAVEGTGGDLLSMTWGLLCSCRTAISMRKSARRRFGNMYGTWRRKRHLRKQATRTPTSSAEVAARTTTSTMSGSV